jgi:uncharacterized protein (DUF952 family)
MAELIYKVCGAGEWQAAVTQGEYGGSADDVRDGFIHFSLARQLAVTLAKYFSGRPDLVLVAVDPEVLGEPLRYETSRGGALFPHLHGVLPVDAARWVKALALVDGAHVLPSLPGAPQA